MEEIWIRLDRPSQILDYLQRSKVFLVECHENPESWKWFVISLHGALYDLAVSACVGANWENVLTKDRKLISFPEAFRRCKDPDNAESLMAETHLVLTEGEQRSLDFLKKELRNPLEHFALGGWSIEVSGMPRIATDCLEVCRKLVSSVVPQYTFTEEEREQIINAIQECKESV